MLYVILEYFDLSWFSVLQTNINLSFPCRLLRIGAIL